MRVRHTIREGCNSSASKRGQILLKGWYYFASRSRKRIVTSLFSGYDYGLYLKMLWEGGEKRDEISWLHRDVCREYRRDCVVVCRFCFVIFRKTATTLTNTLLVAYLPHTNLYMCSTKRRQWLVENGHTLRCFQLICCTREPLEEEEGAEDEEIPVLGFSSSMNVPMESGARFTEYFRVERMEKQCTFRSHESVSGVYAEVWAARVSRLEQSACWVKVQATTSVVLLGHF